MTREVSEEARQKAEKCQHGYACLSDHKSPRCAVRSSVRGVLFVNDRAADHCPYGMSFGYSHICTCPVRWEIHNRYGI
jgi:hypothetical protein